MMVLYETCLLTWLKEMYRKFYKMSHVMRKPVYAICEQRKRRSACASAQSDQHLCCSLSRKYNISSLFLYPKFQAFCGCAGRFESYLVENPEDRFSRDEAQIYSDLAESRRSSNIRHAVCHIIRHENDILCWRDE